MHIVHHPAAVIKVVVSYRSAAEDFSRNSNFWQYKAYAHIRGGSLERARQTTLCASILLRHVPSPVLSMLRISDAK